MKKLLPIVLIAITGLLVAAGAIQGKRLETASTPQATVQSFYERVRGRDFAGAFSYVAKSSNVDPNAFYRDVNGKDGSLRTFSSLQRVETKVMHESDSEAVVRANEQWSTAVGAIYDTRDMNVVKEGGAWKLAGSVEKARNVRPQVSPVT